MDTLTVRLGVNLTKSIIKLEKPFIEEIKKRLGGLIDPNNATVDRVYCGHQTIQAIKCLERSVQDLSNGGIPEYVTLLQEIDAGCANFYKYA